MAATPELLCNFNDRLGECPAWDESTGTVLWIDIHAGRILSYSPATNAHAHWDLPDLVGSFALSDVPGKLIVALRVGFCSYDMRTGTIVQLGDVVPPDMAASGARFNDGRADAAGRFWAGTLVPKTEPGQGALYRIEAGSAPVRRDVAGLRATNCVAWSPGGEIFYMCDSRERRIRKFDYDLATGEFSNERLHADLRDVPGVPDGAAMDDAGSMWVAMAGSGHLARISPAGVVVERVAVPVPWVTACTFGEDGHSLFMTSATYLLSPAELTASRGSGGLFRLRVETPGRPAARYRFGV
jgi:sugar lactone lactonase YvrE